MRTIDIRTCTKAEFDAWLAEFVDAVEDGSLRAELNAKNGRPSTDDEWLTALEVSGYGPPPEDTAR